MKTTAALVWLVATTSVLADKFAASCDINSIVVSGHSLKAVCRDTHGGNVCSVLDLSPCISNNNGQLTQDDPGNGPSFASSCRDCTNAQSSSGFIINLPSNMQCNCQNLAGNYPSTNIDLNTLVSNMDGWLVCGNVHSTGC